jgi:hypothetical protein
VRPNARRQECHFGKNYQYRFRTNVARNAVAEKQMFPFTKWILSAFDCGCLAAPAEASPAGGIPAWSKGSFLAFDGNHGGALVLQVFNRAGQPLLLTTVAIPEATRVNLIVAARSPQGALAVSGTAQDSQRAGANFIAWITPSGVISRVVRTTPFAAMNMAFAPDDTLWALGRELQHNATRPVTTTLLRQYGTTCELLRTALPSETFVSQHPHPVVDALLAVSSDPVGVLSVMATNGPRSLSPGRFLAVGPYRLFAPARLAKAGTQGPAVRCLRLGARRALRRRAVGIDD